MFNLNIFYSFLKFPKKLPTPGLLNNLFMREVQNNYKSQTLSIFCTVQVALRPLGRSPAQNFETIWLSGFAEESPSIVWIWLWALVNANDESITILEMSPFSFSASSKSFWLSSVGHNRSSSAWRISTGHFTRGRISFVLHRNRKWKYENIWLSCVTPFHDIVQKWLTLMPVYVDPLDLAYGIINAISTSFPFLLSMPWPIGRPWSRCHPERS